MKKLKKAQDGYSVNPMLKTALESRQYNLDKEKGKRRSPDKERLDNVEMSRPRGRVLEKKSDKPKSTGFYKTVKGAGPSGGGLKMGGMIKRADGSYSKRGLWDNIRANKGSGKKPTAAMLKQEKKIKANTKKK
jgi:hypothetical protein